MNQAYKYELDPNNACKTLLMQHCGCARFAWNWALAKKIETYETNEGKGRFLSAIDLAKLWTKEKPTWASSLSRRAPVGAMRDLDKAFDNFVREQKKGNASFGFPRFKGKGRCKDSFRTEEAKVFAKSIKLGRIGEIKTKEATDLKGRILSATISRDVDRWFASITVEREGDIKSAFAGAPSVVGVDLGITCFAVISNGQRHYAPKPLAAWTRVLRTRQKALSRKSPGSANREKQKLVVGRTHRRIRRIREDFLNKLSTSLAKTHSVIVVEDLSVRQMIENSRLAKMISDLGWHEFRRKLEYKCAWYGSELIVADRFYPSSKRCSGCGEVKESLRLSERTFRCACGMETDRDLNAAINLEEWYREALGSLKAPGDG